MTRAVPPTPSLPPPLPLPSIDGLAAYGESLEHAPPEVRRLWQLAQLLLAAHVPPPPSATDVDARRAWAREAFAPWARAQWDGVGAVRAQAALPLAHDGPTAAFASIVVANVGLHFVRGLIAARGAEADDETAREWFPVGFAATVAAQAVAARSWLDACRRRTTSAPSPLDRWHDRCRDAAQSLASEVEGIVASAPPDPVTMAPDPNAVPAECDVPREAELDNGVPPPDPASPAATVILEHTGAGPRRNAHALWAATASFVRARGLPPPIAEPEVASAVRSWRSQWAHYEDTTCAPPASPWAVLARRHRNLVGALVGPDCDRPWRLHHTVARGECQMILAFQRLGSTDRAGLPENLMGPVEGDLDDGRELARALERLAPVVHRPDADRATPEDDDPLFLRLGPGGDAATHLRVHAALFSEEAQSALASCASAGYVSYDVEWTLSASSRVQRAQLRSITPPAPNAPAQTACMQRVLSALRFPCSDSHRSATIRARICLRSEWAGGPAR